MISAASAPAPVGQGALARRVLVLASTEDGQAITRVLASACFVAVPCRDLEAVAIEFERGAGAGAGAVILVPDAALRAPRDQQERFATALAAQPEWSDLPVILLAEGPGSEDLAWSFARGLDPLGNVTILERPLRQTTLVNAVAVALRARARQYELRATLEELAAHRERLEELVAAKAAELATSTANLHAAERLASLGTLAAGLGHDLANLTLPIRARLDALRSAVSADEARADLDAIELSLKHLGRLSAGMRLMALDPQRESVSSPVDDLAEWAEDTVPLLRAALPRHIRLVCSIEPGLGVSAPSHRLAQAVFNLVQNAGEAMQGQAAGVVSITARRAPGDDGRPHVQLQVTDDGPGMSPEVLARCFEPYFSTKGRAISTGMGLGLVKGIVEAAGGSIRVESARGRGTTFTIAMRLRDPESSAEHPVDSGAVAALSLTSGRTARLVRLFLDELGWAARAHAASDPPETRVWVVDGADPALVSAFLGGDERRIAVLTAGPTDAGIPDSVSGEFRARVVPVKAHANAAELRDAIATACRAATGTAGKARRV